MFQEIEKEDLGLKLYYKCAKVSEPYKRVNEDYINLLMSLVTNGYSESKIESTLNSLGLDYSKQHMGIIKQGLLERLNDFKTRELPSDIAIL